MKKIITWIVVADHQHARFFRNDGPDHGIQSIEEMSIETKLHRTHDILTDHSGRSTASANGPQHGMELRVDPHRQEGEAFVAEIADALVRGSNEGNFDRLIVIAPPRALGELRKALPKPIHEKVVGELAEDLTKATPAEIHAHVKKYSAA